MSWSSNRSRHDFRQLFEITVLGLPELRAKLQEVDEEMQALKP